MRDRPDEPWWSFLTEIDAKLPAPIDLHCMGGFAIAQVYGFSRSTRDLDYLDINPREARPFLESLAGMESELSRKHRLYLQGVTVSNYPDSYEERVARVFPFWERLRLWVLEPHDLALSKFERNSERDRQDVYYLARQGLINAETLQHRYNTEMRGYLTGPTPTWHDTTMKLWLEACWPPEG